MNINNRNNLQKLRRKMGLTQEELAALLKIKRCSLGAYEEGRADVANYVIKRLVDKGFLLKSQLYDFMFDKNMKPAPTVKFKKIRINYIQRQTA